MSHVAPAQIPASRVSVSASAVTTSGNIISPSPITSGSCSASLDGVLTSIGNEVSFHSSILNYDGKTKQLILTPAITGLFLKFLKVLQDKGELAVMLTSPDIDERKSAEMIGNYLKEK